MLDAQAQARDAVLDMLQESRSTLASIARAIAVNIAWTNGVVTSTEVWQALASMRKTDRWLDAVLTNVDPRWMGVVFRRGWKRIGWVSTGSHKRPVAVWIVSQAA